MATMSETFTRMRENFDQGHQDRQQLIRDLQAEVQAHAARTAEWLAEESENRQAEFAAQMENLRAEISGQAAQTRGVLADFAADLHGGGAVFHCRAERKPSKGSRAEFAADPHRGRAVSRRRAPRKPSKKSR
jgi:hypothetical protein